MEMALYLSTDQEFWWDEDIWRLSSWSD